MKIVKNKIDIKVSEMNVTNEMDAIGCGFHYDLSFYSNEFVADYKSLEIYVDAYEPETIKEFKDSKNLKTKDLINWLNENYK